MTQRLGSRLLAIPVAVAVLLAAPAAHAEKVVTQDAVGDVIEVKIADDSDGTVMSPAPDETSTDVIRTVVAHGNTRLSITVHVRDLVRTSDHASYVRVATPRGAFEISVDKSAGSRAKVSLTRNNGVGIECRGLRARVDGGEDLVAVSLPTSCVEAPRWVRVGVGVLGVELRPTDADPAGIVVFADDGHRGGTIREKGVDLGPKVRRG